MIRLSTLRPTEGELVIRIEGRLDARSVAELRRLAEPLANDASSVTVDLSGLVSLDAAGQSCLVGLRAAGCRLLGGSLYVNRLLQEVEP